MLSSLYGFGTPNYYILPHVTSYKSPTRQWYLMHTLKKDNSIACTWLYCSTASPICVACWFLLASTKFRNFSASRNLPLKLRCVISKESKSGIPYKQTAPFFFLKRAEPHHSLDSCFISCFLLPNATTNFCLQFCHLATEVLTVPCVDMHHMWKLKTVKTVMRIIQICSYGLILLVLLLHTQT